MDDEEAMFDEMMRDAQNADAVDIAMRHDKPIE